MTRPANQRASVRCDSLRASQAGRLGVYPRCNDAKLLSFSPVRRSGPVTVTIAGRKWSEEKQISCCCDGTLPLLDWPERAVSVNNPANIVRQARIAPDPYRFVLERSVEATPGPVWNSNGGRRVLAVR